MLNNFNFFLILIRTIFLSVLFIKTAIMCAFFFMYRKVVCKYDSPVKSVNEKQVSASSHSLQRGKLLEIVL